DQQVLVGHRRAEILRIDQPAHGLDAPGARQIGPGRHVFGSGSRPEKFRATRWIAAWISRSNCVPSTRILPPSARISRALPSVIWPSIEVGTVAVRTSASTRSRTSGGRLSVA